MRDTLRPTRWLIPMVMACPLACAPATPPPAIALGRASTSVPGPAAPIDEMTLERFGHAPNAPFYRIVLTKDGRAT
jgi:hypothetical protein